MRGQRAHRVLDLLVNVQRRALWGCFDTLKRMYVPMMRQGKLAMDLGPERCAGVGPVSYTHLTLPTTPYV